MSDSDSESEYNIDNILEREIFYNYINNIDEITLTFIINRNYDMYIVNTQRVM